jgi:5-methylcytosine-specific restriction endonuclease McrA
MTPPAKSLSRYARSAGESKPAAPLKPVTASRTRFAFDGDDELVSMYRTLQDRLRHKFPAGKLEDLVKEAFGVLLQKTEPAKEPLRKVAPKPPTKHTRYVPSAVRREVWRRDTGACTFTSPSGKRCGERGFLELDHILPWSLGGSSQSADNLTLRCRAHNQYRGGAVPSENRHG